MKTIHFNGIDGKVVESSPHGNYLVIRLSKRVTICGTYSNKWGWDEIDDAAPFLSFITYIGTHSFMEAQKYSEWATKNDGYFERDEDEPRPTKRGDRTFPLELKIRGLSATAVCQLAKRG